MSEPVKSEIIREGQCEFLVPDGPFFNKKAKLSRDMGVIGLRAEAARKGHSLKVIDMMCGIGTRGIRYLREAPVNDLIMADGNKHVVAATAANFARNPVSGDVKVRLEHEQLHRLAYQLRNEQQWFDWVDIDVFGSPAPFWHAASLLTSFESVLYLTATDTAALWGKYAESAFRHYGAVTRKWNCGDEVGIRCLIGSLLRSVGEREFHLKPLFCLDEGYAFRVAVRMHYGIDGYPMKHMGWMGRCQQCLTIWSTSFRDTPSICRVCGGQAQVAGPLWTGPLHDMEYLKEMRAQTDEVEFKHACRALDLMQEECDGPIGYYTMGTIGRTAALKGIPQNKKMAQVLRAAGFNATRTHLEPQAIKTNAPFPTVLELAKTIWPA